MSTQAELIKDCMLRIKILELKLQIEPNNKALQELLDDEKAILEKIERAN